MKTTTEPNKENEIPIPIMESEIKICETCAKEMKEHLTFKILNDHSTLETKIDSCGDAIITIWRERPTIRKYIEETIQCIIQNTIIDIEP